MLSKVERWRAAKPKTLELGATTTTLGPWTRMPWTHPELLVEPSENGEVIIRQPKNVYEGKVTIRKEHVTRLIAWLQENFCEPTHPGI